MHKGSRNHSPEALRDARTLRKDGSISERVLWEFIRKRRLGFLFKRQVPVGVYVLDFYCPEAQICVEVDGEQHLERCERDGARDRSLSGSGIKTIRIPSLDLFEPTGLAIPQWLERITEECELRTGRLAHESQRRSKFGRDE